MKQKRIIRLTETDLHNIIGESVKKALNELTAALADRAAGKAYRTARDGFGLYEPHNELPYDSFHGKKFRQGERFLEYMHDKLGLNDGFHIFYPGNSTIALKDDEGNLVTKPCRSIEELEAEFNKLKSDMK